MAKVNVSLPQGTRDFGPEVVRKRHYILTTIRKVFELYGFQPLETPAMENLETLMGKYGEEGDRLIFKILNNGLNEPSKKEKVREAVEGLLEGKASAVLTERALKYDLTIPFARYVAMHHPELIYPFKRYQMQPVWRADRPQKGRYREFWQCDADTVGSTSLINEAEFCNIYHQVFTLLGMSAYSLHINSRKVLAALATKCGGSQWMTAITTAIDKLDKTGWEKVKAELEQKGLQQDQIETIHAYLQIQGSNQERLTQMENLLGPSTDAQEGIAELRHLIQSGMVDAAAHLVVDFTLARGLDYYTGIIFEAKAPPGVTMGSIGGGGRYDDLTGLFGVPGIPGVGISFGLDRIYDVMETLSLFPASLAQSCRALFFHTGTETVAWAYKVMQQLREHNIACEMYPEETRFDKQFKYAERRNIPYAVIIGSKEVESRTLVVKNLQKGEQVTYSIDELSRISFD